MLLITLLLVLVSVTLFVVDTKAVRLFVVELTNVFEIAIVVVSNVILSNKCGLWKDNIKYRICLGRSP